MSNISFVFWAIEFQGKKCFWYLLTFTKDTSPWNLVICNDFGNRDKETDPDVLERRQKQIDYGKNSVTYQNYRRLVIKAKRKNHEPKTPRKNLKWPRRTWDTMIRWWKKDIYIWNDQGDQALLDRWNSRQKRIRVITEQVSEASSRSTVFAHVVSAAKNQ